MAFGTQQDWQGCLVAQKKFVKMFFIFKEKIKKELELLVGLKKRMKWHPPLKKLKHWQKLV